MQGNRDYLKDLQRQQVNILRRGAVNYINKSLPLPFRQPPPNKQKVGGRRGRAVKAPRSQPYKEPLQPPPLPGFTFDRNFINPFLTQPPKPLQPSNVTNIYFNGEHYGGTGGNNPFESGIKNKNLLIKSSNPAFDKDIYKKFNRQIYKDVDINEDPTSNYIEKGGKLVGQVLASGVFGVGGALLKEASLASAKSGLISGLASSALNIGVPLLAGGLIAGVPYLANKGYQKGKKIFEAKKEKSKMGGMKQAGIQAVQRQQQQQQQPQEEQIPVALKYDDVPLGVPYGQKYEDFMKKIEEQQDIDDYLEYLKYLEEDKPNIDPNLFAVGDRRLILSGEAEGGATRIRPTYEDDILEVEGVASGGGGGGDIPESASIERAINYLMSALAVAEKNDQFQKTFITKATGELNDSKMSHSSILRKYLSILDSEESDKIKIGKVTQSRKEAKQAKEKAIAKAKGKTTEL